VNRKGALTGGYHDHKGSRLEAIKAVKKVQATLDKLKEELTALQANLESRWRLCVRRPTWSRLIHNGRGCVHY
jgi:hypothetical protein